jgi:hypothetical protein
MSSRRETTGQWRAAKALASLVLSVADKMSDWSARITFRGIPRHEVFAVGPAAELFRSASRRRVAMEKKVISLLGSSFFLVISGVVLYLWSLFNSRDGFVLAGTIPILLILVGAFGFNISWILHDVVERLTRLERDREGRISSAKTGEAEPGATADRPRE